MKIGLPETVPELAAAITAGFALTLLSNPWGWYAWWLFLWYTETEAAH